MTIAHTWLVLGFVVVLGVTDEVSVRVVVRVRFGVGVGPTIELGVGLGLALGFWLLGLGLSHDYALVTGQAFLLVCL